MTEASADYTCPDCGADHRDQINDYPIGIFVETVVDILYSQSEKQISMMPKGTVGKIVDHCNDGRAQVMLGNLIHTFHNPDAFIAKVVPSKSEENSTVTMMGTSPLGELRPRMPPQLRKIVINSGIGGFGLSYKAVMRYAELKGITLYAANLLHPASSKAVPYYGDEPALFVHYATSPLNEKSEFNDEDYFYETLIPRDDPSLVRAVEELGIEANSRMSKLKIVEIPTDVEWEIQNSSDGRESVHEKHRVWK